MNNEKCLFYPYTEYEIYRHANEKMENTVSCGADAIPNILLKKYMTSLEYVYLERLRYL